MRPKSIGFGVQPYSPTNGTADGSFNCMQGAPNPKPCGAGADPEPTRGCYAHPSSSSMRCSTHNDDAANQSMMRRDGPVDWEPCVTSSGGLRGDEKRGRYVENETGAPS